jgi:5'-nucleotidase/UDP-sugar diphosphatase
VDIATIGGKAFDPAATYSFSIPSFSAAGGDGYPKIDTINAGLVDAGVLKDYIAAKKTIQVADYQPAGEVSYINSTSVEGCK